MSLGSILEIGAGAVLSAFGAPEVGVPLIGAGIATEAAGDSAEAQAEAARYNAERAEQQAKYAKYQAGVDAEAATINAGRLLGSVRAAYGASGVKMEGSAQDVYESDASILAHNILNIKMRGQFGAEQYLSQAQQYARAAGYDEEGGTLKGVAIGVQAAGGLAGSVYGGSRETPKSMPTTYQPGSWSPYGSVNTAPNPYAPVGDNGAGQLRRF